MQYSTSGGGSQQRDSKPPESPAEEPKIGNEPQSGADYLLQRFLGSGSVQAMRKALAAFSTANEDDDTYSHSQLGKLQQQPSLTARLKASLFGTDLGAASTFSV